MRVVKEMDIREFDPWGCAVEFYNRLNDLEFDLLDDYFEECFDSIDETTLNDIMWLDDEYLITEVLGEDYDEYYARKPLR